MNSRIFQPLQESNRIHGLTFSAIWKGLILLSWALLIAVFFFKAAKTTNEKYYERWPLQGDTMSYWSRDISLARVPVPGQASPSHRVQAWYGAKQNGKDPIRTAFFGLLPANSPSLVNGHLYFSTITLFLFLLFLMLLLQRRTGSLTYALAAPFVALLPSGLLNPMYGLPSRLPDFPASCLLGASLFALFSGKNSRRSELIWLFIAGMLLGLATMARFQLWIYGLFILGPITVLFAIRRYLTGSKQPKDLLIYPIVFVSGLGVVAGKFILAWTREMLAFYSVAGYSLNASISTSLKTSGLQFLAYLGVSALLAGTLVLAGYVALQKKEWSEIDRWDAGAVLWALASYPILLFFIMRVESIVEQTYYIVPGLLLFLLAPFAKRSSSGANLEFRTYAAFLVLLLPLAVWAKTHGYLHSEAFLYPREKEMAVATFQRSLAEHVAVNIPAGSSTRLATLDSNFNYYSRFIELLTKNKFNRDCRSQMVFQIRQSQWKLAFTGEEEKDKKQIMSALAEKVDIFMALTNPIPKMKDSTFVDDYTEHLAEHVNKEMAANPSVWGKRGTVVGPYGEVTIYVNRTRQL